MERDHVSADRTIERADSMATTPNLIAASALPDYYLLRDFELDLSIQSTKEESEETEPITSVSIHCHADHDTIYVRWREASDGNTAIIDEQTETEVSGDIVLTHTFTLTGVKSLNCYIFNIDGVGFADEELSVISPLENITVTRVKINPDKIQFIGDGAFRDLIDEQLYGITSDEIFAPRTAFSSRNVLSAIGVRAFYGCGNSEAIYKGETGFFVPYNTRTIGKGAFQDSYLTAISLPNTLTSIGDGAFDGISGLEKVVYRGTEEQWAAVTIGPDNEPLTNANIVFQPTYTVTFDSNGGSECEPEILDNRYVAFPQYPTKYAATFQYWTLNGERYDFSTRVTEDITLVAAWEAWVPTPTTVRCNISVDEPRVSVSFSFSQPVDEGIGIDWGDGNTTTARYDNTSAISDFTREETGSPVGTWEHQYAQAGHVTIQIIPTYESKIVLCGDYTRSRSAIMFSDSD